MRQPHIIVVCFDQLRPFELPCYGGQVVRTPHLDAFAAEAVRVEHAVSNNPVCSPARAVLVTGQYGRTCLGMLGNWGAPDRVRNRCPLPTLPEVLGQAGYDTVHLGKWHIAVHPFLLGFRNYASAEDDRPLGIPNYFPCGRTGDWQEENADFGPAAEDALFAEHFRQRPVQPGGKPLFLFANIHLPHGPWDLAEEPWREMYGRGDVVLRPNTRRDGRPAHDPRWYGIYEHGAAKAKAMADHGIPPDYDLIEAHRRYYGMISRADDQFGRLAALLRAQGVWDDAIVIVTADHGENLGSHGLWNKETMNEESIRIPLLVRWPGRLRPGVVQRQLASLLDLAPTVAGLAGLPFPSHWQGRDLSPVLRGAAAELPDNRVFIEGLQGHIAVRTPEHLYELRTTGSWCNQPPRSLVPDSDRCFALASDPWQQHDLCAGRPTAAALRAQLLAWHARTPWLDQAHLLHLPSVASA